MSSLSAEVLFFWGSLGGPGSSFYSFSQAAPLFVQPAQPLPVQDTPIRDGMFELQA